MSKALIKRSYENVLNFCKDKLTINFKMGQSLMFLKHKSRNVKHILLVFINYINVVNFTTLY